MIFSCYPPHHLLQELVHDYLLIDFDLTALEHVPVKPYPVCPKQGLIFYLKGTVNTKDYGNGATNVRPKTVVFGQPLHRQDLFLPKKYLAISVRFRPGGLHKLLRLPMSELAHRNEDAEIFFGKSIQELHAKLEEITNYQEMLGLIDHFLIQHCKKVNLNNHPFDKVAKLMVDTPQHLSIDKISEQACMSRSQLERRFLQQVGVQPKMFLRISRFYKAFLLKQRQPELSWLDVAWDSGYHDYQHMVKDFKKFGNTTPRALTEQNYSSPEQALSLNPNFLYD